MTSGSLIERTVGRAGDESGENGAQVLDRRMNCKVDGSANGAATPAICFDRR